MPALTREQRILTVLMRLAAAPMMLAFGAVAMPTFWMAATHEWLGLGEFPQAPIVDYLARSASAIYGFHGVLLFAISTDVVRYRSLVPVLGWTYIVFGVVVVFIDLHAGLPLYWTLSEGPPTALFGGVMLYLSNTRRRPLASRF